MSDTGTASTPRPNGDWIDVLPYIAKYRGQKTLNDEQPIGHWRGLCCCVEQMLQTQLMDLSHDMHKAI
jgi:hypothetical protein